MKTELIPFKKEMISDAGMLLAQRHKRNRGFLPFLPMRFENKDVATKAVFKLFEKKTASGFATFRNGKMVAYLLGDTSNEPWGRCGWVRLPGSAIADSESPTLLQDLYVLLGDDWTKRGVFIHHTYFSIADKDLVDAWFGLDFGKERIDAVLDLRKVEIPAIQIPEGVEIRRARSGDNDHLAGMSHIIFRQLEKAPYWHPTPPEAWGELREGWGELADDKTVDAWLALEEKRTVSTIASWATMHPEEETDTDMLAGENIFSFSIAATRPEARERGIATALLWMCLAHNRDQGFEYCYTNWISPNLSASRFWPRFGFQEVAFRLTRNINPMISWTRETE